MSADRCYAWRLAPTASLPPGCSQRRRPALRARPAARRSMLASTAAGRRRTSDSIAATARLRSPWMSLATKDATTRARRPASSGSMPAQLEPVGVCVAMLRPLLLASLRYFPDAREENGWSGPQARRRRWWRVSSSRADLPTFFCAVERGDALTPSPALNAAAPGAWTGGCCLQGMRAPPPARFSRTPRTRRE